MGVTDVVFELLLFAILGLTAGTLSGLFGIGGGMVIVPGLFYLFHLMEIPREVLMHVAAGTSMGIMIFTSASSTLAHHTRGDVHWRFFRRIIGAIAAGVIFGKLVANHLPTDALEIVFGLFLLVVAVKILLDWKPTPGEPRDPHPHLTTLVGGAIGLKSGILGIGGGALSVPFLLYNGLPMSQASGTSASLTLPIALVGTATCWLLPETTGLPWSTGYIYWPAVVMVAPFTVLGAPLGTRLSHQLPAQRLKTLFGAFLLFLSLRLLGGSFYHFLG